jgi:hypothetical protein
MTQRQPPKLWFALTAVSFGAFLLARLLGH